VKDRTWRSRPNQDHRYPGPFAGSYECQLPAEARIELEEASSPRIREKPQLSPSKPRIRVRAVGRYVPEDLAQPEVVFLRPPPPVSVPRQAVTVPPQPVLPLPPSVTPPVVRPAPSESRGSNGGWWLLAILIGLPLLLSRLGHDGAQPQSRPTEVRRALPAVEVRKALPVTSVASSIPQWGWQSIRMPDGEVVNVHYDGALSSSASLPGQGTYIGQEFSVGLTSWVWMVARGTNFPAWIDP
jgi:hypothetical protein